MVGPGRIWQSAKALLNSADVIHLRCSTSMRRDQYITPPKPESEMVAKARKSWRMVGRGGGAGPGGGGADAGSDGGAAWGIVSDMRAD